MYETFEHTADLGIRIRAADAEQLLIDAAYGLFSVIAPNASNVQAVESVQCRVRGDDIEDLLHDWLAELLFIFHTRRLLLTKFRVQFDFSGIIGSAVGEPIDPVRHEIQTEVKAITWHSLKVRQSPHEWFAEVIVDV
jgi:SHS2 domain-containing protein